MREDRQLPEKDIDDIEAYEWRGNPDWDTYCVIFHGHWIDIFEGHENVSPHFRLFPREYQLARRVWLWN